MCHVISWRIHAAWRSGMTAKMNTDPRTAANIFGARTSSRCSPWGLDAWNQDP
jgi:hypothetical protein